MKCSYLIGFLSFLCVCESRHLTGCVDSYVWLASGSVECKYLYTPSHYGLHNKAKYFCTKYSQTNCCDTCTDLGFVKGKGTSPTQTTQTVSTPVTSTGTTTVAETLTLGTGTPPIGCVDTHVWSADGSIDCKFLYTASAYKLHTRKTAEFHCTKDKQTRCCATCSRLGFNPVTSTTTPPSNGSPYTSETVSTSTIQQQQQQFPVSKSPNAVVSVILKTLDMANL